MTERWDARTLLGLPVGTRRYKDGILVKRTSTGLSWYAVFRVPVAAGVKKTKVVHEHLQNVENMAQARSVRDLRRAEVFTGTYAPRAVHATVASFYERFRELKADLRTLYKYEWQFKHRLLPEFGAKPLDAVTPGDVEAYYKRRIASGASLSTARSEVAALRSFFSAAQRDGKARSNPAKLVRTKTPNNARDRILSDSEILKLFAAAEAREDYVRPLVFLLYFTGRRVSEAVEIRWSDVEFEHGRIRFVDAKSDDVTHAPMHERLREELVRWREFLGVDDDSRERMFPSPRIEHIQQPHSLRTTLKAVAEDITPHTLRHNLVSQLQRRGVAVNVIAQYTGHKTLTMLYRYSHANTAIVRESLTAMPVPGQTPGKHSTHPQETSSAYVHPESRKKLRKIAVRTR